MVRSFVVRQVYARDFRRIDTLGESPRNGGGVARRTKHGSSLQGELRHADDCMRRNGVLRVACSGFAQDAMLRAACSGLHAQGCMHRIACSGFAEITSAN